MGITREWSVSGQYIWPVISLTHEDATLTTEKDPPPPPCHARVTRGGVGTNPDLGFYPAPACHGVPCTVITLYWQINCINFISLPLVKIPIGRRCRVGSGPGLTGGGGGGGRIPANTKHLYNICTTSGQRLRRWPNIVQILDKCFVFAGI